MRFAVLCFAAAALAAIPGHAQTTRPCQPTVPEEPARPRTPADSARDYARAAAHASLRTELLQAAQNAGVEAPAGIVFVRTQPGSDGEPPSWTYRSNVSDSVVAAVVAARAGVLAALVDTLVGVTSFRLDRVDPPDQPATECLPRLVNPQQLARELERVARRLTAPPGEDPVVSLTVQMLVTRDGEVAHAMIIHGATGTELDGEVVAHARRLRFLPAALDDVRVDVWVTLPLTVRLPEAVARRGDRDRP